MRRGRRSGPFSFRFLMSPEAQSPARRNARALRRARGSFWEGTRDQTSEQNSRRCCGTSSPRRRSRSSTWVADGTHLLTFRERGHVAIGLEERAAGRHGTRPQRCEVGAGIPRARPCRHTIRRIFAMLAFKCTHRAPRCWASCIRSSPGVLSAPSRGETTTGGGRALRVCMHRGGDRLRRRTLPHARHTIPRACRAIRSVVASAWRAA